VTWQKQALYDEVPKPNRIGHPIRHKVHKLVPDGNSKLAIVGIIAEGVIVLRMCQMPANAWSITASVLGSYMSGRGF
jgi:hypothetical protein